MPNVVLSRESLLFYQQSKMNAKVQSRSLPVVFDDTYQEDGNRGLKSPVALRTKALQGRKAETDGKIKSVKPLQDAAASHKKISEDILLNTSNHLLQVAPEEHHRELNGSKKKGRAKVKGKESTVLQNASKTQINEVEKMKIGKKRDSRQRSKRDTKKQSAENIHEPVYEPTPKRLRIVSNAQSFTTNMASVIGASANNFSKTYKSNQTLEENIDAKTVSESPAKQMATKPAVTIGTKTPGSTRSEKKLPVSENNCTELEDFASIDGVQSAKSDRTKKKRVPAGSADGGTELPTSLSKRSMSTKKGLENNANTSGPITSWLLDEPLSDKAADIDTTESEDETCSSYSEVDEDVIFSRSGNILENLSPNSSISPNGIETSKQKDKASESSLSPEFDHWQKCSKSLPGLVLPSPRKQLSFADDSLAVDCDLSTTNTDKHKNTEEKSVKSSGSRNLSKNLSSSKSEASRISANVRTLKEGKQSNGSPALKRKRFVGYTETHLPNKQLPSSLVASLYHEPLANADRDLDVRERSPTQHSKMTFTEESMLGTNCRMTPSYLSDECTAVPMPTRHPTTFNLYMSPSTYPVRARQIESTEDFVVSWLYLQPTVIFPLQTSFRTMIMRLKGSVEFRSDPCVPSRMLLNSEAKLVELEACRLFHIANTGEEVALIQMTEVLR
ncbi:uncharacterized protein LOC130695384 [Daphnia carinata]|uniref:uncharacterized protein LOC130695384 n=1 Tax=Daphnia carinata TaxID=120202 RepID=UPI00257F2C5E|nr:uncharacterized protein LOC130695384 [Daphnia carinata]